MSHSDGKSWVDEGTERVPKAAPDGEAVIRTIAMPTDTNPAGDIFGGWLVAQMDLAAGSAAARRAQGRCVTVSIESVRFHEPVHVGDEVSVHVALDRVGRTSMVFDVTAWSRSRDGHARRRVCEGRFVFVAIDSGDRPRGVPREV